MFVLDPDRSLPNKTCLPTEAEWAPATTLNVPRLLISTLVTTSAARPTGRGIAQSECSKQHHEHGPISDGDHSLLKKFHV
jgi:hypothetical protein